MIKGVEVSERIIGKIIALGTSVTYSHHLEKWGLLAR